jgi:hypothetical protein
MGAKQSKAVCLHVSRHAKLTHVHPVAGCHLHNVPSGGGDAHKVHGLCGLVVRDAEHLVEEGPAGRGYRQDPVPYSDISDGNSGT